MYIVLGASGHVGSVVESVTLANPRSGEPILRN